MLQSKYDHYWIIYIKQYMNKITKKLENLYSWTKFYQDRADKESIRKCQTEIAQLKQAFNQLKSKK